MRHPFLYICITEDMSFCEIHDDIDKFNDDISDCESSEEYEVQENRQLPQVLQDLIIDLVNFSIDKIHGTCFGEVLQKSRLYTHTTESVLAFDTFCRYFFPFMFFLMNILYWLIYSVI